MRRLCDLCVYVCAVKCLFFLFTSLRDAKAITLSDHLMAAGRKGCCMKAYYCFPPKMRPFFTSFEPNLVKTFVSNINSETISVEKHLFWHLTYLRSQPHPTIFHLSPFTVCFSFCFFSLSFSTHQTHKKKRERSWTNPPKKIRRRKQKEKERKNTLVSYNVLTIDG